MADYGLTLLHGVCADLRRSRAESGENTEKEKAAWCALQTLCPEALPGAAEILDTKTVTRVVAAPSGREYFLVDGTGKSTAHTCLPGFCTCMSYSQSVAVEHRQLVCKHELAVLLANALDKCFARELSDAEWSSQLALNINKAIANPGLS